MDFNKINIDDFDISTSNIRSLKRLIDSSINKDRYVIRKKTLVTKKLKDPVVDFSFSRDKDDTLKCLKFIDMFPFFDVISEMTIISKNLCKYVKLQDYHIHRFSTIEKNNRERIVDGYMRSSRKIVHYFIDRLNYGEMNKDLLLTFWVSYCQSYYMYVYYDIIVTEKKKISNLNYFNSGNSSYIRLYGDYIKDMSINELILCAHRLLTEYPGSGINNDTLEYFETLFKRYCSFVCYLHDKIYYDNPLHRELKQTEDGRKIPCINKDFLYDGCMLFGPYANKINLEDKIAKIEDSPLSDDNPFTPDVTSAMVNHNSQIKSKNLGDFMDQLLDSHTIKILSDGYKKSLYKYYISPGEHIRFIHNKGVNSSVYSAIISASRSKYYAALSKFQRTISIKEKKGYYMRLMEIQSSERSILAEKKSNNIFKDVQKYIIDSDPSCSTLQDSRVSEQLFYRDIHIDFIWFMYIAILTQLRSSGFKGNLDFCIRIESEDVDKSDDFNTNMLKDQNGEVKKYIPMLIFLGEKAYCIYKSNVVYTTYNVIFAYSFWFQMIILLKSKGSDTKTINTIYKFLSDSELLINLFDIKAQIKLNKITKKTKNKQSVPNTIKF